MMWTAPPPWFFAAEHLFQRAWRLSRSSRVPQLPEMDKPFCGLSSQGALLGLLLVQKSYSRWVMAPVLLLQLLLCREDPGGEC